MQQLSGAVDLFINFTGIRGRNGKVAVEMAQRVSPNVIILDLSRPVMNGLDATRQIREIAPNVCILLFTMHESPQLAQEAEKVGVNEVLLKSGDTARLLRAVRSLLDA